MNRLSFFLAQIDSRESLLSDLHKTGLSRGGLTPLFWAFGILTLLILFWAIFIRKRPDETSRRYTYPSRDSKGDAAGSSDSSPKAEKRRRRRRKRRSRNPTLAETGGLPPLRADGYFEDPP
jgi:hypothetical protein